jgi:hypothetical protein
VGHAGQVGVQDLLSVKAGDQNIELGCVCFDDFKRDQLQFVDIL